jgi:hypothetical protein
MPHPISSRVWRYEDVKNHWDAIEIRSRVDGNPYQEGKLDRFMRVEDLVRAVVDAGFSNLDGCVIYGGTIPTIDGIVYGSQFEAELHDPVLRRTIMCNYSIRMAVHGG